MGTQPLEIAHLPRRTIGLVIFGRAGESAKRFLDCCASSDSRALASHEPTNKHQFQGMLADLCVHNNRSTVKIFWRQSVANRWQRQRGAAATRDNTPKAARPPGTPHHYLTDVPSRGSAPRLRTGSGHRDRSACMHGRQKNFDDFVTVVDVALQQQPDDCEAGFNTPTRGTPPGRDLAELSCRQT